MSPVSHRKRTWGRAAFVLLAAGAALGAASMGSCRETQREPAPMEAKKRFDRFEIPGLAPRPAWWAVRNEEIVAAVGGVRKGRVEKIATTAYGYPVHAVAYGPPRAKAGTATWAIGSNSRNMASYKTDEGGPQVVMIVAGVHAAEPEAIVGAVNLISLLETGKDLRGKARPKLVELAAKYRLVILPCVNMDGRSISPDHLRGATPEQFRLASQGWWADGTAVGYPACKEYSPLPLDRVGHPGGYPNGEGFNIMHDCAPGLLQTDEARGILKLTADEQADLVLHMHSHPIGGQVLGAPLPAYPLHVERTHAYKQRVFDALAAAGLRPGPVHGPDQRMGANLCMATSLASGGLSVVFEQCATGDMSFDESLDEFYVVMETFLEWGTKEKFSPRRATARGQSADEPPAETR